MISQILDSSETSLWVRVPHSWSCWKIGLLEWDPFSLAVTPAVAFVGLVPGRTSQYDVEIAWPRGEYFGELNFTVGCQATDDFGRPLETVQPLRVAVVEQFQLP